MCKQTYDRSNESLFTTIIFKKPNRKMKMNQIIKTFPKSDAKKLNNNKRLQAQKQQEKRAANPT